MTSQLSEILAGLGKRADKFGMKAYKNNWMLYALIILILVALVALFK